MSDFSSFSQQKHHYISSFGGASNVHHGVKLGMLVKVFAIAGTWVSMVVAIF